MPRLQAWKSGGGTSCGADLDIWTFHEAQHCWHHSRSHWVSLRFYSLELQGGRRTITVTLGWVWISVSLAGAIPIVSVHLEVLEVREDHSSLSRYMPRECSFGDVENLHVSCSYDVIKSRTDLW